MVAATPDLWWVSRGVALLVGVAATVGATRATICRPGHRALDTAAEGTTTATLPGGGCSVIASDVNGFGARLRELRVARRMTMPALGRTAGYGRGYLWELEAGRKPPSLAAAQRLDEVLAAGGTLLALAIGSQPLDALAGGVGEVWAGDRRIVVRSLVTGPLVTVGIEIPVVGRALPSAIRDLACTGTVRAAISLDAVAAAELARLLDKAIGATE